MNSSDPELLRRYTEEKSEAAFAELARRHFDLVYSAASRQLMGDADLARDVAQTVFVDLARKARSLIGRASLAGWLYTSTHFAAAKVVRVEQRRRAREQIAVAMQESASGSDDYWERLSPVLDRAMQELSAQDREAVLLRFFEQRGLRGVGEALEVSEDAARKRVDRALEKLRTILSRQGFTSTSASLAAALTGQAVATAPVGVAASVVQATLASLATGGTLTTLIHTLAMTKPQLAGLTTLLLAAVTVPLYLQHRTIQDLRAENARGRQLAAAAAREQTPPVGLLPADAAELERLRGEHAELLRLRGEVSRLRRQLAEAALKPPAPVAPTAPPIESEPPLEPVQIFVANADATVPAGQTLAFGGWATPPGKRTFVFVKPKIVEAAIAGGVGSIMLESHFFEIPEESLTKVVLDLNLGGLEKLKTDGKASSVHSLFTADETALVLKALQNTTGVDLLSAPRVQTANGRQAVVSVTDQVMVAGQEYTLGPSLDVEPRIAADGSSVNLTVLARLRKTSAPQQNAP